MPGIGMAEFRLPGLPVRIRNAALIRLLVGLLGLLVLAALMVATRYYLLEGEARALRDGEAELRGITALAVETIEDRLSEIDLAVSKIVTLYDIGVAGGGMSEAAFVSAMRAEQARLVRAPTALGIVDASGHTTLTTRGAALAGAFTGDREYFGRHRDDPEVETLLSGPILSRNSREASIYLTQSVRGQRGEFRGVAFAAINVAVFEESLRAFWFNRRTSMSVALAGGAVLGRYPPAVSGSVISDGDSRTFVVPRTVAAEHGDVITVATTSSGITAAGASRRFPITVRISLSRPDALHAWREGVPLVLGTATLLGGLVVLVCLLLLRQIAVGQAHGRSQAAALELSEAAQHAARLGFWTWHHGTRQVRLSAGLAKALAVPGDPPRIAAPALLRRLKRPDRIRLLAALRALRRQDTMPAVELRMEIDGRSEWLELRAFRQHGAAADTVIGTVLNITHRKAVEAEFAALAGKLQSVQEDERLRLARDLHDEMGQSLTMLSLQLARQNAAQSLEDARRLGHECSGAIAQLSTMVDRIVNELRPGAIDEFGLEQALRIYCASWSRNAGVPAQLEFWNDAGIEVPPSLGVTLYRICQEALTNVGRHARAAHVRVIVTVTRDEVHLLVEDDGIGFDAARQLAQPGRFGLGGMMERAMLHGGRINIDSTPGQGTSIDVRLALEAGGLAG